MKLCIVLLAGLAISAAQDSPTFDTAVLPILRNHCESCHNSIEGSGGLNLKDFETEDTLTSRRDEWRRILRRVRDGQMPPRSVPKPAHLADMISYLERELEPAN